MRTAVWVVLVAGLGLGGLAASVALGQSLPVPVPTVSTPTVSVPSVTLPSVTVPPITTPAPGPTTPPVQTPPAQTPPVHASGSGAGVGGAGVSTGGSGGGGGSTSNGGGGSSGSSSGGSASTSSGSSSGGSSAAGATGARSSSGAARMSSTRSWIAAHGPKRRRVTTLRFRLAGNGLVRFTVMQVAPVCRLVGTFQVHGHRGINRVRFGGRVHGTQLAAGTYRITARTRSGRAIAVTTLVIVDARAPSPQELAFARQSDVCAASGVLGEAAVRGSLMAAVRTGTNGGASTIVRNQKTSAGKPSHNESSGDDNSSPIASAPLAVAEKAKSPIVIALLGLAVLMLGLAAVPRTAIADPRVTALVATHRLELTGAGTAALLAAIVAMMLA